ncbi:MAG: Gfo/Idh/MocA family oxidoreductase [Kiritimatiellae bacterium]|nr:Gfo/Idh/MocA family oxidoreductase [Kiritimatiellia bacterium]
MDPHEARLRTRAISRRHFLRSAVGAAGAGWMMARSARAQDAPAATPGADPLHVAIIGTGVQGRVLLKDCLKIPGLRFKAVCDIWAYSQRYARNTLKKYDQLVSVYEDYREMLEKETDLDAVIVATPDFVHAEHALACLQAGKHVYCEKEMAHTLQNAASMVAAARNSGKIMQIGHQRRSNPVYRYALEMIDKDNVCGRITNCYGQWNRTAQAKLTWPPQYIIAPDVLKKYGYDTMDRFRNWRWFRDFSAGPIADLGSHQIDIFSWFLHADPASLVAVGGHDYYPDREWYEDVMTVYEYPYKRDGKSSAVRAFYQVLNTNGFGHYYERFHGDQGTLTISEDPRKCYYVPEAGRELPEWMAGVEPAERDGYQAVLLPKVLANKSAEAAAAMGLCETKSIHQWHLENFFDAVRAGDKRRLTCPPEAAYPTAVAVLSVIPALEAGEKHRFKPEDYQA